VYPAPKKREIEKRFAWAKELPKKEEVAEPADESVEESQGY